MDSNLDRFGEYPIWKNLAYLTAYGLAVKHGYEGTEEEWLASLEAGELQIKVENGRLYYKTTKEEEWTEIPEFSQVIEDLQTAASNAENAADAANTLVESAETALGTVQSTLEESQTMLESLQEQDEALMQWEEYDNTKSYSPPAKVVSDGSSYLNIKSSTGISPPDAEHWLLIAAKGDKGQKGDKGNPGEKGETGAQGVQGPPGPKGDPFSYGDFTEEQLEALKGPAGPQGPTGPQGIQGQPGPQGPRGIPGETGATGPQGPAGPYFSPAMSNGWLSWQNNGGLSNPDPINLMGPQGAPGQTGNPGPQGEPGPTGPPGPQGEKGETGATGPQGPQGVQGPIGPQGETGPQGNPGATPTIAVGAVTTLDPGQDATAEITGQTPDLTLNLGIPQGQPGKDGVQLNDNAVSTTEAWSSKKIVDTLCPPFTETGNPITCNPVEGYPLSAVVTLEPKQAGSGDPSPENVRPISGYDEVTVNVRGKNVVDVDDTPDAHVGSTGYYYTAVLPFKPYLGVTFTLSANVRCLTESYTGNWQLNLGCGNGNYNKDISRNNDWGAEQGARISVTGTCDEQDVKYQNLAFRLRVQTPTLGVTFAITNIMLEVSDTPTPYEPYQPGTTATITLPATIYGGTVDAVTGEGEKTWEFVEFDGTEDWILYPDKLENCITLCLSISRVQIGFFTSVCNCFKNVMRSWQHDTPWQYSDHDSNNYKYFVVPISEIPDLDSWKSYLAAQATAGTPVQVAYKLATPEPFQATGNQPLPAVAGLNTVYTDGDSLAVSGRQDLLYTLQTMQAQTTNLNRFIAEGGTQ